MPPPFQSHFLFWLFLYIIAFFISVLYHRFAFFTFFFVISAVTRILRLQKGLQRQLFNSRQKYNPNAVGVVNNPQKFFLIIFRCKGIGRTAAYAVYISLTVNAPCNNYLPAFTDRFQRVISLIWGKPSETESSAP